MTLDKIIVLIFGIGGIICTYLFFFGKKEDKKEVKGSVNITVDGGYSPNVIVVKKNAETTLRFFRKDPNTCLEEISIPDFKIKQNLPMNKYTEIKITPKKKGDFPFSCGMNMYFGKISVI